MITEVFNNYKYEHVSSGKFSISSVGCCWRKKFLELKGRYKEEYDAKTLRTFDLGDAFHRQACKELMEKGHAFGLHVSATEVNIPEQKNISGRADQMIANQATGEIYVIDIKSCSDWTLKKAQEGEVPQNYKDQVNLYLHFFGLKKGYLIFFGKHKGTVVEYEVAYDQARAEQLIAEINNFIEYNVAKDIEPPKCEGSHFGCKCCGTKGDFK